MCHVAHSVNTFFIMTDGTFNANEDMLQLQISFQWSARYISAVHAKPIIVSREIPIGNPRDPCYGHTSIICDNSVTTQNL